jgi:hypothetical protein
LAGFGIFWNHFNTRIHTQQSGFWVGLGERGIKCCRPMIATSI